MNSNLLPRLTFRILLLGAFCILLSGCESLLSPPAHTPPKAAWQAAPGFSANSLTKLAVIAEDRTRGSRTPQNAMVRAVEDEFITKVLQKGYHVSARSDVQKVLEEIRFQHSGLTEADAAKLGRILNVSAVLLVTINNASVTSEYTGWVVNGVRQQQHTAVCNMSARLISVEKAEILGITSFSSQVYTENRNDTSPAIFQTARVIAEAVPTHSQELGTGP